MYCSASAASHHASTPSSNPLPDSLEVVPKRGEDVELIAQRIEYLRRPGQLGGIEKVNYGKKTAKKILQIAKDDRVTGRAAADVPELAARLRGCLEHGDRASAALEGVRCGEPSSIVHTIAHHRDCIATFLKVGDNSHLVCWKHACDHMLVVSLDSNLSSNGNGGLTIVTSE